MNVLITVLIAYLFMLLNFFPEQLYIEKTWSNIEQNTRLIIFY